MKCRLCEDKILEYLYGELDEEESAAMERHLEASDACRQAYEGYSSVLGTVAGEGEEGPSPALHTRIMGHAQEARPARRSSRAWMFRPAVTTAVIGAVAAGVYFTTLRHKPPSILDERTLSEESIVGKSRQRSAPPSSIAKLGSPKKEAKDKGFLAKLAESEPRQTIEKDAAAPEGLETHEESAPVPLTRPAEMKSRFMAVGSTDEELAPAQARRKLETLPAEEDRAVEEATVPDAIAQALNLANEGQCAEAGRMVETYTTDHPKEKASGAGWLEVARCHAKKGDTETARKMAGEALKIPAYESEARTFLATLPP